MFSHRQTILAICLLGLWSGLTAIGCQSLNQPCMTNDDCCVRQVCCPECKTEKVEKDCFEVECEEICIPPIHCPFGDECTPRCGTVIAVKKLKKKTIDCGEKQKLSYKLVCPDCGRSNCAACESSTGCGCSH